MGRSVERISYSLPEPINAFAAPQARRTDRTDQGWCADYIAPDSTAHVLILLLRCRRAGDLTGSRADRPAGDGG